MIKKVLIDGQEYDATSRPLKFVTTKQGDFSVSYVIDDDVLDDDLLSNLDNLTEVVIPEGVTEINEAFKSCKKLKKVTIPQSVTKIQSNAFYDCDEIEEVKFEGTKSPDVTDEKDLFLRATTKIIVPEEAKDDYSEKLGLETNIMSETEAEETVDYEFDNTIHIGDIFYVDYTIKKFVFAPVGFTDDHNRKNLGVVAIVDSSIQGKDVQAVTIIALHNVAEDGTESDYSTVTSEEYRADRVYWADPTQPDFDTIMDQLMKVEYVDPNDDTSTKVGLGYALVHFPIITYENQKFNYEIHSAANSAYVPTDDIGSTFQQVQMNYVPYGGDAGTYAYPFQQYDSSIHTNYMTLSPYKKSRINGKAEFNEEICYLQYTGNPDRGNTTKNADFGNCFCGLVKPYSNTKLLASIGEGKYFPAAYVAYNYDAGISNLMNCWYLPSPLQCAAVIARLKEINEGLKFAGGDNFERTQDASGNWTPNDYPILTVCYGGYQTTSDYYTTGYKCCAAFIGSHEIFVYNVGDSSYKVRPFLTVTSTFITQCYNQRESE